MKIKLCNKCEKEKPVDEFYTQQQRGKNGEIWPYHDSYCKQCRTEYAVNRLKERKKKAVEYKGGKCVDCGIIDDPCIYDFHHTDPSKKEIAFGSAGGVSFDRIRPELDKCVLLCANCHRKRHQKL
jgi:hypothetical protein